MSLNESVPQPPLKPIIGNLADNEDFQPILCDAIRRFVAPGGRILPMSTTSYLVPVAAKC